MNKYKSINICGMAESIYCHGRPHDGCSILYSDQYDVTPIYFKEERRIVGIKISLCNTIFHILTYTCRVMIIQLMLMRCITMFSTPCHCIVPIIMLTLVF